MYTFSKDFNLLMGDDLSIFFNEVVNSGYPSLVSSEYELKKLIHFGGKIFPDTAFTISRGGMISIYVHPKWAISYDFLGEILPIIYFLYSFGDDSHFTTKVKTNLINLPQFDDTIFELKCLNHFYTNGFSFQYEPKVFDGNRGKNPDFQLNKDDIELFCECKQVRIGQNIAELQFTRQCNYVEGKFPDDIQKKLFDTELRLEVNFKRSPSLPDLNELATQVGRLSRSAEGVRKLALQQIGNSIEYLVVPQSELSHFPTKSMRLGRILVGSDEPRILLNPATKSPTGEIVISSTDLSRRKRQTLVGLIREANNQLPNDKLGIMIMGRTSLSIAKETIEERMNGEHFDNIVACVVNPFENFWACFRTLYRELLFDLFEGFQHKNPFKSN